MKFLKWATVLSLVFFISCGGNKETANPSKDAKEEDRILEEHAQAVEPIALKDQAVQSEAGKTTDGIQKNLKCNIHNYSDYIYDFQEMNRLVTETGAGCYLPGVDFSDRDLTGAFLIKSNLKGAVFKGAVLKGTRFFESDLTNAVLEDTNYMEAYFRGAILTEVTYNEYDRGVAWIRSVNGQGIFDPKGEGMIYEGD
ncbi:MAG: pentapeptide repeat-containing protein [Oligoflexia bacterium]|nr:pentapeptide repeat-containing protein [Oligoflexia bacterium]